MERDAQRLDSVDENVLFDTRDPFQLDMHRPLLGEGAGAEVRSTEVS
jgi:hypothetical protein